jgi:hypothetical protein
MCWCEQNKVDFLFGLARNQRLTRIIGASMQQARLLHQSTAKPARVFTEFTYQTRRSWSCSRRVVAKAEFLDKGENPRFVVTSLTSEQWAGQQLYEQFYCARGEMEKRIKEQMCLFADRLSTDEMKGNQLRLYFSAFAYTLIEALRRLGLKGTEWAQAQVDTIRIKLLKSEPSYASACAESCCNLARRTPGKTFTPVSSMPCAAEHHIPLRKLGHSTRHGSSQALARPKSTVATQNNPDRPQHPRGRAITPYKIAAKMPAPPPSTLALKRVRNAG